MDSQILLESLQHTVNPEPQLRKAAEDRLEELRDQQGFLVGLLNIIQDPSIPQGIKQAAAIYFKNQIRKKWDTEEKSILSEAERIEIKRRILESMAVSSESVNSQFTTSVGTILASDFPEKWPEFVFGIQGLLTSSDANAVKVGVLSLLELVMVYRYKAESKCGPMEEIFAALFPLVLAIVEKLSEATTEDAYVVRKTAFKTFQRSILVTLPQSLQETNTLVSWVRVLVHTVSQDIIDDDDYDGPAWKCKKWAYHCLNRLYGRYGNPATLTKSLSKYKPFAVEFTNQLAKEVASKYLVEIQKHVEGKVVQSPRVRYMIAVFFNECIQEKVMWQTVNPYLDLIIFQFVFKELSYNEEDEDCWTSNPVDYVHRKIDPMEDFRSPSMAASALLVDIAYQRKKKTLVPILEFLNGVLAAYNEQEPSKRDAHVKDGALNMISCLADQLSAKNSPLFGQIETFLKFHVFPELSSPNPFLRVRAVDTFGKFSDLDATDYNSYAAALQQVISLLNDKEIPVRIYAALSLRYFAGEPLAKSIIVENLPVIMRALLEMTNIVDADLITEVIETFADNYAEEIEPFAIDLAQNLSSTFFNILSGVTAGGADGTDISIETDEDILSEKAIAAAGILKTLVTLVFNLDKSPKIVEKFEEIVYPVVRVVLQHEIIDLYDEAFEIIDTCTYTLKNITPQAWSLFELVIATFKGTGIDFLTEMLPTFDNYVSYGGEVLSTNPDILQKIFEVFQYTITNEESTPADLVNGFKLAESMLLNCRGMMDSIVPTILTLTFQCAETRQSQAIVIYSILVAMNTLFYNPTLTMAYMEQRGISTSFFTSLNEKVETIQRVHDKKALVCGLTAVISVPPEQIPAGVQQALPLIMNSLLVTFQSLPKAIEEYKKAEKMYLGDLSDDEDEKEEIEDDNDLDEDDNVTDVAGSEWLDEDDDDLSDDDDFEDSLLEEEFSFESPIDEMDPFEHFKTTLKGMEAGQSQMFKSICDMLTPDQKSFISTMSMPVEKEQ